MKQFAISDARSANKIGVDGVLIGSWAPLLTTYRRILDAGCGCGISSLMMAQRMPEATVVGIDIESNAIEEAIDNAGHSPFAERIRILSMGFEDIVDKVGCGLEDRFDLIVSNPPFFASGVNPEKSERMLARHVGSLSPEKLIVESRKCLNPGGLLAFIAPYEYLEHYLNLSIDNGYRIFKICKVKGNPDVKAKRVMIALQKIEPSLVRDYSNGLIEAINIDTLVIENSPGEFTPEYIDLGRQFYLRF